MDEKIQIEAAARNLLRRFGDDALRQADIRVKELHDHGEAAGLNFWQAVRGMVQCLLQGDSSAKH
ncbi:MAG: hypothetical protein O2967_01350 [Proteobacteria bacterium]|nr:hypothetical protein [Pseudomonadota bacterium]